jgi:cellulose synthase/poly-beta-1,6-N-acetylglucosamine synthase-like glycosyltransferase
VGRDGGKARNLNIGLGLKPLAGEYYDPKSDLYFLIDSDIEFPPDILRKSLPEFNTNPRLPFVIFEADDLADNNLFNSSLAAINMAAQHNVVGIENAGFTTSGGYGLLYNRQAWNVIGGWKENFVGEDWATGIALRTASEYFTKGKRVSYVKVIDHTPEDLNGFKIQQQRWAKGGVETTLKLIPALLKAKHIPWNEKIDILVRYSFYSTMVFSLVILPALTAIVGTALSIAGNASMGILSFFVEIYRGFFIPMLAAVGINTVFAFLRREKSVGLKNLLMFMPSLFAYGGVGLAVFKGLVQGLYDKKKVFNVTPKTRLENKGEFFRIIRQNWKEITFGAALLGVGVFTLPYYLQFVALVGLSFIISPFMSLVKFNKKDKPERK